MQFFVHLGVQARVIRRGTLTPELIGLEIGRVKEMLVAGTISQAWKREDCHYVVLLIDAFDEQGCRGVLATLPFSKAGILDIQLIAPVEPYLAVNPGPLQTG